MTKRPVKINGVYNIKGKKYPELIGSRAQVNNGNAYKTSGGLVKKDLCKNKYGRRVSVKKYKLAKKEKRLEKAGYFTKKGVFGSHKKANMTKKNKSKKNKSKKNKSNKKH